MPTSEMENATVYINAADTSAITSSYRSSTYTIHNSWEPNNNACESVPVYNPWEDKLKEYCSSTDKHLDDLEEDIEFLDKMRKNTDSELGLHEDRMDGLESKLDLLKNENAILRIALEDLQNQIYTLQEKLDN